MIVLSNTSAQTLEPGQSITFTLAVIQSGNGESYRPGSSVVRMKANGIYDVSFNANIASTVALGVAQLAIQLGGETLPETTIKSTSTNATQLQNVGCSTIIRNHCCEADRLTVVNTGTTSVLVDANPSFRIRRVG